MSDCLEKFVRNDHAENMINCGFFGTVGGLAFAIAAPVGLFFAITSSDGPWTWACSILFGLAVLTTTCCAAITFAGCLTRHGLFCTSSIVPVMTSADAPDIGSLRSAVVAQGSNFS